MSLIGMGLLAHERFPPATTSTLFVTNPSETNFRSMLYINVVVSEGVVHLWGMALSEEEKNAMCVAAEAVTGTRQVCERITLLPRGAGQVTCPPPHAKGTLPFRQMKGSVPFVVAPRWETKGAYSKHVLIGVNRRPAGQDSNGEHIRPSGRWPLPAPR